MDLPTWCQIFKKGTPRGRPNCSIAITEQPGTSCKGGKGLPLPPTLYNGRLQDIARMMYMYKVKKEMVPNCILELFNTQKKGYNLRNNDFKDSTQQDSGSILSITLGLTLWSRLSDNNRKKPSITSFIRARDLSSLQKTTAPLTNFVVNDNIKLYFLELYIVYIW